MHRRVYGVFPGSNPQNESVPAITAEKCMKTDPASKEDSTEIENPSKYFFRLPHTWRDVHISNRKG